MRTSSHAVLGLAVATCFPQVVAEASRGVPRLAFLAVLCAVLPDVLERMRRGFVQHDGWVLLDPLNPDPDAMVLGIARAAFQTLESGAPCRVRIHPLPSALNMPVFAPWVRLDAVARRVQAGLTQGSVMAEKPLPRLVPCWPDRFSLEAREGLLLEFRPGATQADRLQLMFLGRGWPHGLPFTAAMIAGLAMVWGVLPAAVAGCVLLVHLATDQAGLLGVNLWAPFRHARIPTGWRWWNGASNAANAVALCSAGVVLYGNLARHTDYLPWRPSLPLQALLAVLLSWGCLRLIQAGTTPVRSKQRPLL